MTSRAKRLTLIVSVAALVAVVVGGVIAPELLAAPKEKPPKPGSFVITTAEAWICAGTAGSFEASGAIGGTGQAYESWCDTGDIVYLRGDLGWMDIEIISKNPKKQSFEVVYADGEYAGLLGATGSYSHSSRTSKGGFWRTFEGTVPK